MPSPTFRHPRRSTLLALLYHRSSSIRAASIILSSSQWPSSIIALLVLGWYRHRDLSALQAFRAAPPRAAHCCSILPFSWFCLPFHSWFCLPADSCVLPPRLFLCFAYHPIPAIQHCPLVVAHGTPFLLPIGFPSQPPACQPSFLLPPTCFA